MINREAQSEVITLMQVFPAVGLLGPREIVKRRVESFYMVIQR